MTKRFYLLLGFIFIFYIIYIRIILQKAPKDLEIFSSFEVINFKLCVTIIGAVIINIIIIYKSFIFVFNFRLNENELFAKITLFYKNFIDKALEEVYIYFMNSFFKEPYDFVSKFASKFYSFFGYRHEGLFIFISIFCRIIILTIFLFEVFYFFKLKYFYKFLILLCIPMFINIIIYILKTVAENLEDIKENLIITEKEIAENGEPLYIITPSPGNEDINLEYYLKEYILCSRLTGYLEIYHGINNYFTIRANIIIHSLYLIGWLYIIVENIKIYFIFTQIIL